MKKGYDVPIAPKRGSDEYKALPFSTKQANTKTQSPTPRAEPSKRNPQVISGAIRERAEMIVNRYSPQAAGCGLDSMDDAQRILALLDELDASLLETMLSRSIAERAR